MEAKKEVEEYWKTNPKFESKINPESYGVHKLVSYASSKMKDNELMLDAVPQSAEVSEEREGEKASYPYDYFRFAKSGITYLLEKVGFTVIFVEPRGGYFWYIGHRLRMLGIWAKELNKILGVPFYFLFSILIPLLCFYLDEWSRRFESIWQATSKWTLGYNMFVTKPTLE